MDREIGDGPQCFAAVGANLGQLRVVGAARRVGEGYFVGRVEQEYGGGDRFQHRQVINRAVFI